MHDRTRPPAPDGFKFRIIWTAVDTLTGGRTCQCQAQGQADDISGPHTGRTGLQTAPSHDLSAVRRNRISFQQRLRSKPVERRRNRAEPKPYTTIGCKKTVVNDIDYCTVISMSRRRCITVQPQPHFEKQRWRNRAGPRMFSVRAEANTTHLTRRRHR